MDPKDRVGMSIAFVIFIGIGAWDVSDPNATEGYDAVGRRAGVKQLVADFWGVKPGLAVIAVGVLALFGLHGTKDQ
jgi:hypothetical protein